MPRLSDIEGAEVRGPDGRRLGSVERVLFHPSEPHAVALMVRPEPALLVVSLPFAYLPWRDAAVEPGTVRVAAAKLPSRRATEKALALEMDATVIWRGMPVADADGSVVGSVGDMTLREDGAVDLLDVSSGGVGDVAFGRLTTPGETVTGFADGSVRVNVRAADLAASGGLAAKAAGTATAAKAAAATMATATGDAVVDASYIAGRAIRSAVRARPLKRTSSRLRGIADAFREGYSGDETRKGGER